MYAACSGGVVYCCFGKVCRIVPCVYKIYTLGRLHSLLGTFLFAVGGGDVYREEEVCISVIVTRVAGVLLHARAHTHAHARSFGLWTLECVFHGNVGIHRAPKAIQVDGSRPRRVSLRGFPGSSLSGTFESYGASAVARTSGRGHVTEA